MKFVEPSSEVFASDFLIHSYDPPCTDPYRLIEKCGRICYKSTCGNTPETSVDFVKRLIEHKHFAMLEHATFVFEVTEALFKVINESRFYNHLIGNDFLNTSVSVGEHTRNRFLVSGNVRALNNSRCLPLLYELGIYYPELAYALPELHQDTALCMVGVTRDCYPVKMVHVRDLPDLCREEFMAHTYLTYHVVTDRGVSHEIVRHRLFSFAQESTRYCNYAKDKFGNELTFITPTGWDSLPETVQCLLKNSYKQAEDTYLNLVGRWKCECTPQMARAVLPNGIKTEMCITGNLFEWEHFFDLRYFGTTGEPHPDMKVLSTLMYPEYEKKFTERGFDVLSY